MAKQLNKPSRYAKPGPGVAKDAPQKKSFVVFFEIYFRKFWSLCVANLWYVLLSLPVLTRGLADAGLTYITRNFSREKHAFVTEDFFDTIKKNWKQALPVGIINTALLAVILYALYFYYCSEGTMATVGLAVTGCLYILFTVMKYYIPMMMVTFRFSLKQLYRNAFLMVMAGWKANVVISLVLLLFYGLIVGLWSVSGVLCVVVALLLYLFFFPAFRSLLIQYAIFPTIQRTIIDPYYKEHPDADKDKRRDLNLETPEDPDEPEAVFVDRGVTKPEEDDQPEKAPAKTFPRQYTESEMRRLERKRQAAQNADDDDTI